MYILTRVKKHEYKLYIRANTKLGIHTNTNFANVHLLKNKKRKRNQNKTGKKNQTEKEPKKKGKIVPRARRLRPLSAHYTCPIARGWRARAADRPLSLSYG
jgi:hypothetical protein